MRVEPPASVTMEQLQRSGHRSPTKSPTRSMGPSDRGDGDGIRRKTAEIPESGRGAARPGGRLAARPSGRLAARPAGDWRPGAAGDGQAGAAGDGRPGPAGDWRPGPGGRLAARRGGDGGPARRETGGPAQRETGSLARRETGGPGAAGDGQPGAAGDGRPGAAGDMRDRSPGAGRLRGPSRGSGSGSPEASGSDSESSGDSDEGEGPRLKSSVAHVRRGSDDGSKNRRTSSSPEHRDRERGRSQSRSRSRSRSRSPDRERSEERGRRYGRGYYGPGRNRDRSRDRYSSRERYRERRSSRERDRGGRSSRDREPEVRRRGRSPSPAPRDNLPAEEPAVKKKKEELDPILTRTGGAYIPPAKLRMMQAQITDKSSLAFQRMSWEALKKSINGLINKVNVSNIGNIIHELLQENIVRGRGLLSRSILQAQSASPIFTHVYAAVVAIINSKFPQIGELILKRLILNFRKGYRRNDKQQCLTASKFVAHLINQNVAHEVLCLEMLTLLLERPTDDSVEVAISFLKECGLKLTEVSPRGINAIFERLRNILHESEIDKRVQYMIEVMFAIRKDGFKEHPIVPDGLDLVEEEDQFTHMLPLEDEYNQEDILNVFKMDPDFLDNEDKYKSIRREILDEGSSDSDDNGEGSDEEDDEEEEEEEGADEQEKITIFDKTEVNLVAFRRTIYLAIQSSLDFEECAHKLIKMDFPDSQTKELCNMILDCCAQQRTYEKFFGLLAGRFCLLKKDYMESFEAIFQEQYETIHRLETNKLRNVARMFAHLLYTDSIPWSVMECIKVSEDTTTSSSRIFVKILFQELCAYMGLPKLNERLKDFTLQSFFEGLFPRDNPRNTRFAINFFTSIGLGGLTDELREHLKNAPKIIMTQKQEVESSDSDSSSSSSESSSSDSDSSGDDSGSSSDSSSDSGSSSSSSDSDSRRKRKEKSAKKKDKGYSRPPRAEERPARRPESRRRDDSPEEIGPQHRPARHREREREREPNETHKDQERRPNRDHGDDQADPHKRRDDAKNGSQPEQDRERQRGREEPASRRRERSKSPDRSRKEADTRDLYRNGEERPAERSDKENRHSNRYRESRKTEERNRDTSPRRRR
ncbi:hypothetical protein AAFF_G00351780 [Aldrovandia affinis]|uniref:Pre-mRNA-splicing factor CWC22 homolog n=1 Tax=Aldrovandia affinis TaxID=143900 RepID=A0AAD7WNC0_9TELE|nr:hypothetical protein AAFF_G00351780 [Aldrovandia affinis]